MSGGGPHFVDRMISRDKDMKDMAAAPAASDWFAMRIFCVVFLCFLYFFLNSYLSFLYQQTEQY